MNHDNNSNQPASPDYSSLTEQQQQEILQQYTNEAVKQVPQQKWLHYLVLTMAVSYSLFHLYITYYPLPELLQRACHVGFGLSLIFLLYPANSKHKGQAAKPQDWLLAVLSLACVGYLFIQYKALVTTRGGIPNPLDISFAILCVALVLEAGRRAIGWILPTLSCVFLLYPFISNYDFMPQRLLTRPYELGDIFGQMYLKTDGIFSSAIGASVTFIFLFILFGAFLAKSGMGKLFNDLAMALAGHQQGGPAKVAVISSGFMGSINGTAVANVVGTGAFTIPLMIKVGYQRNFAGAVEASASVGGQLLPPIMGASAFIMAETTGVSYTTIALAALIPALLYYLGVIAQVHFRAGKSNLVGIAKTDLPRVKEVLLARGHLLLPIVALVWFLFRSVPIGYAATYTIVLTIAVAALRKNTRMSLGDIVAALEDGARQALSVMVACAVVGLIIGVVNLTSFGTVMTASIMSFGAGSLLLTLVFTMFASMILGMGLPSIPAYIITATMAAPALAQFDIPMLVSHLFVFYFGLFANITPPVALAAFAGAGIAGGNPMQTGFQSLKLALAGFIVPFVFVYNPALLMVDSSSVAITNNQLVFAPWLDIAIVTFSTSVGIIALSAAIEGFFKTKLSWWQRLVLPLGAMLCIIPEGWSDSLGLVVVTLIFGYNILSCRQKSTR